MGRPEKAFRNQALLVEFKHFSAEEAKRLGVADWTEPLPEDTRQVSAYAADIRSRYPEYTVRRHAVYTISHTGFRFFTIAD